MIAYNDDAPNTLNSRIEEILGVGNTCYVEIGNFLGRSGEMQLRVSSQTREADSSP